MARTSALPGTGPDGEARISRAAFDEIYVMESGSGAGVATNITLAVMSFTASAGATLLAVRWLGRVVGRRAKGVR